MAEIKALDRIGNKWARNAANAGASYTEGIQNPRRSWASSAAAANSSYVAGVTAAAQAGAFQRGVQRVGDAKWSARATTLGPARFGPGVAAAQDDYTRGYAPYREAIAGARLSPRRPKRDPGNRTRINEMLDAIVAAKARQSGATR